MNTICALLIISQLSVFFRELALDCQQSHHCSTTREAITKTMGDKIIWITKISWYNYTKTKYNRPAKVMELRVFSIKPSTS